MNPENLLSRIRVILCRPSHPGNIGAAARAMKTMGIGSLCLVQPKQFPDPEADARATGAVDILRHARITDTLADALSGTVFAVALSARQREIGPPITTPRQAVQRLLAEAQGGDVALVFGNETVGLSNDEIQSCQAAVTIPTVADFSSLNLGSAVQVLCYECRMSAFEGNAPVFSQGATPFTSKAATLDEIEGFFDHLQSVMTDTGFFNPEHPGRLMPKLRRLFSRVRLERDEVNILRGILSSTQVKTGHGR